MQGHRHAHVAWHALRFLVASAIALVIVLAILYASLTYMSTRSGTAARPAQQQYTDAEKLDILSSLTASSTAHTTAAKKKTLQSMQSTSSVSVSESQKLDILKGLHN